ncbi:MAG: hypothetical protein ACOVP2_08450 [Armatimonadaceae bacterium]
MIAATVMRLRGGCMAEPICDFQIKNLRVGADNCVHPRVSRRGWLMDDSMIAATVVRSRGGCLALVPRSPDVTRNPIPNWFGWAYRYYFLPRWVDHPRWQLSNFRHAAVVLPIVDGARPDSRRMHGGLQNLISGQSG